MSARESPAERARTAREVAFEILRRVEDRHAWASVLLDRRESALSDRREAGLLREVVLGVLRRRGSLDHVLAAHSRRSLDRVDPVVRTALRIGAYSILFLDRVPDFAAVDTAVDLVRRAGSGRATGFVNGVLRRIAREGRGALPPVPPEGDVAGLAVHHSHPRWWVERVVGRLGWERASALLAADNEPAPTVLRPNLGRTTPRDLQHRLRREGVETEPCTFVREALRVVSGLPTRTRAFREGFAWIQDEASQLVPRLFGRVLRPRVADLCAAPGTKSAQLHEGLPSGGWIVAVDRHASRLARVREASRRLGLEGVGTVVADLTRGPALRGRFDHVLLDAPCSGTGTLRRHPEIRWRLDPAGIERLAANQRSMLERAATIVERGGSLVYAVCSLEPEEGERVVRDFLDERRDFRQADTAPVLPASVRPLIDEDGALRTDPARGGLDGFYATLLRREDL